MNMRCAAIPAGRMSVPVMVVVRMAMRVLEAFVRVSVAMQFGHMKPDANCHQRSGD